MDTTENWTETTTFISPTPGLWTAIRWQWLAVTGFNLANKKGEKALYHYQFPEPPPLLSTKDSLYSKGTQSALRVRGWRRGCTEPVFGMQLYSCSKLNCRSWVQPLTWNASLWASGSWASHKDDKHYSAPGEKEREPAQSQLPASWSMTLHWHPKGKVHLHSLSWRANYTFRWEFPGETCGRVSPMHNVLSVTN